MVDLSQVRVNGPLVPWVDGFRDRLLALGYSVSSAGAQLHLMSHVSRWLAQEGLGVSELTAGRVEEFLMARRAEGHSQRLSENAMMPLLAYFRGLGVLPFSPPKALTPVEVLVEEYRRYLESERGLAPMSVKRYLGVSRLFLSQRPQVEGLGLGALAASEVTVFVVAECRRRGPAAKSVVTGLRSLLRFLFVAGYTTCELSSAVPAVAGWAGGSLPQPLSTADVAVLLTTDDDRAVGLRDHAIVVVLVRLGLRAGEVAALDLDDLDWRAGELLVRGKGGRCDKLPVPVDVGEALVAYLQNGRPQVESRALFVRAHAPLERVSAVAVSSIVRRACLRRGLPPAGAHRLRHSAGTAILDGGGSLVEVGAVLRHARLATSAIYAKVDRIALGELAQSWPGLPA